MLSGLVHERSGDQLAGLELGQRASLRSKDSATTERVSPEAAHRATVVIYQGWLPDSANIRPNHFVARFARERLLKFWHI